MAASTSSVLWAEWRRGLKDLQNAVLNPWNGVTQVHEESGTIGNPTQQIVTEDIRGSESFDALLDRHGAGHSPASREQVMERD
jgi:hypothetical protein